MLRYQVIPPRSLRELVGFTVPGAAGRFPVPTLAMPLLSINWRSAYLWTKRGEIFDQKLTYKEYVTKALQRGEKAAIGLRRLRNLRPKNARQLFWSTVTPVVGDASVIWLPRLTK